MLSNPHIDLLDLFPAASTAGQTPLVLPASCLALVGPVPSSSLLHLALNHLRQSDSDAQSPALPQSTRARGKQRARDDDDDLDLSAAAGDSGDEGGGDLCTSSSPAQQRRVLILTPDEAALRDELAREGDVSLFGSRRDGETVRLLDKVDIRYLPSSSHLTYFLSAVHTFSSRHAPDAQAAYRDSGAKSLLDPTCLPYDPTLVVLHSPSDYLDEPVNEGCGIDAYASIVAHFLSTGARLGSSSPLLVVIDPLAAHTSLPLLPARLQAKTKTKKRSFGDEGDPAPTTTTTGGDRNSMALVSVLERFFDYVGEVEPIPPASPPAPDIAPPGPQQQQQSQHLLLSCAASPRLRTTTLARPASAHLHRVGLEVVLHRVGEDDAEGEEPGRTRIEVRGG
ncbi:hypothetical protein JCM3775_007096 [Rhodotorula graminis]|uniref:Uncharacterized protein n=1 Tax=Rhodotorula graminis (strain WP1) TaxID=578459 RepID=A0A194SDW1_RHOGW|nr:uncharacterized protein RHOBADRAFT_41214 [Rhodotorula graminis WP1]KPV78670.1 hypothetical protein RHOBADRAFT_41214 [Rhodotorula graminis WP1]